ncbi:MAG: NADH-quinone oxidoreductase subunit NuoE [Pseudonocardiales bacterium]|nr:NADH-quinone oxidoreductase subunit NuoE [Pseudonocardiales bacterium]
MTNFRTAVTIDRVGNPAAFSEDVRLAAHEIIARYPEGQARSALLPMLHLVQSEEGYISADGVAFCADVLGITHAQVAAVATFYTMYKRSPTGEYLVSVCTNTLCGLLGGDDIYKTLSDTLGVGMNGTTADGKITLEHAECLAACDYAPVVTVNYEFFDNQTTDSALGLVSKLRAGDRPLPSRGAPLCSFKEISRQIAGFLDPRPESLEAVAAGVPTMIGVRLADERGEHAPPYASETPNPAAGAAQAQGAPNESSANDAPLKTAESDPANPAPPAGQKAGS